jgi:hypothetical protein
MNLLPILAITATALYLKGKSDTAEKLEYYFKRFKVTGTLRSPKLDYVTDIVNPTERDLKVDYIFANIYAGDTQIGRIQINKPFTIKKLQTTELVIPVDLLTGKTAQAFVEAIINKDLPELKAVGTANSGGFIRPINVSYKLSL